MAKISLTEYSRLKSILLSDKINTPARLNDAIRSDVLDVLSRYMDIDRNSFVLDVDTLENGYKISMTGEAAKRQRA